MSAKNWLLENGFARFVDLFEENEIEDDILFDLTDADLVTIGIPLGPRKRLLKALKAGAGETPSRTEFKTGAERRHLTVMITDLVASTDLSSKLDPEDMREVILAFQNAVAGEISRLNGHVARFMGDGVLAYFGYPGANEDDAVRAVRAGLAIAEIVGAQKAPNGQTLGVRIGIATGLVVVGDLISNGESEERAVVGDTPNLAARLQALALPGKVVIAPETRRLVQAAFEMEDLGEFDLKGLPNPVRAWRVNGISDHQSRFEARRAEVRSALVGREPELALITERWHQAREGEGQMFIVAGEAGIGKSRIVQALVDEVSAEKPIRIGYQCSPYHSDSAFYPIIQHLLHGAGIQPDDAIDLKLDKIEAIVDGNPEESALLADLMGIDGSSRYGALEVSPARKRVRFMQLLLEILMRLSRKRPVLIQFEDMHWIDASSMELLELALDPFSQERLFVVATARPDFEHGIGGHPAVTQLTLNRLGRAQVEEIAERLTGGAKLPAELLEVIAARTDGVPLYVEELTKTILETGILKEIDGQLELTGALDMLAIPTTLHDSLMARLDRLQPIKEVAQMAACIGRTFSYRALSALSNLGDQSLQDALEGLIKAELIFRRGAASDAVYTFKHALVRDAAYESLLRSRRTELHKRLLAALEAEGDAEPPDLKAHHAEAAGEMEKAVQYWHQAGEAAYARPAWKEAINHFRSALRLVDPLTVDPQWQHKKMELLLRLGVSLAATRSFTDPAASEAFNTARRLAKEVGNSPLSILALNLSWVSSHCAGENDVAMEAAKEAMTVCEGLNSPIAQVIGNRMMGATLIHRGDLAAGLEYLRTCVDLYKPTQSGNLMETAGVYAHGDMAMALWALGYPDQSAQYVQSLDSLVEQLKLPLARIVSLCLETIVMQITRRRDERNRIRDQLSALLNEPEMAVWKLFLDLDTALEDAAQGNSEALDTARTKADAVQDQNHYLYLPIYLSEHAALLSAHGSHEPALKRLDDAMAMMERNDEHFYAAEAQRIRGDILLAAPGRDEGLAEEAFHKAIQIAKNQEAKSLELRAATSLAQLWQGQGRHVEANDLLQPVYDWFTEGFDFPDQLAARTMLDELATRH